MRRPLLIALLGLGLVLVGAAALLLMLDDRPPGYLVEKVVPDDRFPR